MAEFTILFNFSFRTNVHNTMSELTLNSPHFQLAKREYSLSSQSIRNTAHCSFNPPSHRTNVNPPSNRFNVEPHPHRINFDSFNVNGVPFSGNSENLLENILTNNSTFRLNIHERTFNIEMSGNYDATQIHRQMQKFLGNSVQSNLAVKPSDSLAAIEHPVEIIELSSDEDAENTKNALLAREKKTNHEKGLSHCPSPKKKRRVQKSLSSVSSSNPEHDTKTANPKEKLELKKEKPCESSCSTVTSDEDKKYKPEKFVKRRRAKQEKRRVQKSLTNVSSSDSEHEAERVKPKDKHKLKKEKPVMEPALELSLEGISCGSSCSTVTSDDEKNYKPEKFLELRRAKQETHKKTKLLMRTGVSMLMDNMKVNESHKAQNVSGEEDSEDDFWKTTK